MRGNRVLRVLLLGSVLVTAALGSFARGDGVPHVVQCYSPHFSTNYYEALFTIGKEAASPGYPATLLFILPPNSEHERVGYTTRCTHGRFSALLECDVMVSESSRYHVSLVQPTGENRLIATASKQGDVASSPVQLDVCVGHDHFSETGY